MTTDGDHIYECLQCAVTVNVLSSVMGALHCRCSKCGLEMKFNPRQHADSDGAQWGVYRVWPAKPLDDVPPAYEDADLTL
ncbi:MAG: hypothetical protein OXK21_09890 [Chloroflexota bacterium]|nr:hypothetical protein [Chloroflexota bacterium]